MNPKLSVVIPAYNHARFIGEAIDSVLSQSFDDFELVITDDGSTDGTVEVIQGYSDPRIKLEVFAQNRGPVVCLNASIRRAKGELVSVLNSDDFFLPGKLEKQIHFLRDNRDIAAVFGMLRQVDEKSRPLPLDPYFSIPFGNATPSRQRWLRHFFFNGNCLCHPTVMIRRAAYDDVGLYDPRLWNLADFDLWVRLCMRHEIRVLPEEMTGFRKLENGRNMSANRADTLLRDMFEFFEILKHYRKLDPVVARKVFAEDIASARILVQDAYLLWLGEVALLGGRPAHHLFALDSLYDGLAGAESASRFVDLTGKVDPFRLKAEKNLLARLNLDLLTPGTHRQASVASRARGASAGNIGRNEPCPCGSGKKYKLCHGAGV